MNAFVMETWAQLRRWLIRLGREPFNLTFALMQPLLIFVFFGSSFEGVVPREIAGMSYRAFLLGGMLALTVFGNSMSGGISLLFDKEGGFLTRCLVAPVSRASIFVARFLAVNIVSAIQMILMILLARLFGVEIASGVPGVGVMLALGWLLGFGVTVLSLSLVFTLRGHADFFALVGTITLPITFLSTAFAPLDRMPTWMKVIASANPMSYAVNGMRSLILSPALQLDAIALTALILLGFDIVMLAVGVRVLRRHVA